MGIPMLKIRQYRDRLIFKMGNPYLVKTIFILRQGPGYLHHRLINTAEYEQREIYVHVCYL